MQKRIHRIWTDESKTAFLLIVPAALGLVIFSLFPIIDAIRSSFFDVSTLSLEYNYVGLSNYLTAFRDPVFRISLRNTVFYTIFAVLIQVVLALLLALLLRRPFPGVGLFRTAFFLPGVTSMVVVATIWKILFHTDVGIINSFLRMLNLTPVGWLTNPAVSLWSIIIIGVWKEVGFSMLILLGGLNAIANDYYEAASIDGASWWVCFVKITLPLLKRSILFVVVLATINAVRVFIPVHILTQGGPVNSTQTLVHYIYQTVFRYYKAGYGSSLSIILLILVGAIVGLQFRVLRSDIEY